MPARIVVLASGTGSLLEALLAATRADGYPAAIVAVGVDRDCAATDHAANAGVAHFKVALGEHADRAAWDVAFTEAVAAHRPDLVVSAGFMKILGPAFMERFGGRIINTHPALLPAFPGAHAVRDALAYGVRVTGSTVHLVDSGVDTGPILAQERSRSASTTTRRRCTSASRLSNGDCWPRSWPPSPSEVLFPTDERP